MNTYKVKPRDTLTRIAAMAGVTVSDLVKLNNLANPDHIRVGQVLKIGRYNGQDNPSHDNITQGEKTLPELISAAMEAIDALPEVQALMEAIK